jgi:streptomycin 6-kinase
MAVVAEAARLDRERLGLWLLAHAGVSAAWCLAEGAHVRAAFAVAEMARANVQA